MALGALLGSETEGDAVWSGPVDAAWVECDVSAGFDDLHHGNEVRGPREVIPGEWDLMKAGVRIQCWGTPGSALWSEGYAITEPVTVVV